MKKLIVMAFIAAGVFFPKNSNAFNVQGWANIVRTATGSTLYCNGTYGVCCSINGINITIYHYTGTIHGILNSVYNAPPPENTPIPFVEQNPGQ